MGWLNKKYKDPMQIPVAHWTVLSSLIDFSQPGEIEAFINEQSLATLETLMASKGYLDKQQIAWAFRMLRPNSLLWHYVVHNYLYGETPPPFDVLYWNTDSTRLPFALQRFCLRELYMENKLAKRNGIRLNGQAIDMVMVQQPLYAVGTDEDHITPWRGTFRSLSLINSPARYVLSTSGHILGIINPPSSTSSRRYWAGEATGEIDHKAWYARQIMQPGSWWPDWSAWLQEKCGPLVTPSAIHPDYPPLCDAPGTYVLEQ
jgi:polyhydroxyalkanoate synthase